MLAKTFDLFFLVFYTKKWLEQNPDIARQLELPTQ